MMVKVACPCGHTGVVSAESLPRDLVCSQCGSSRYVEPERSARIISTARREEQVAAFLRAAGSAR
jgi:hypothetical protein